MDTHDEIRRKLWCDVYVVLLPTSHPDDARDHAHGAVWEFDQRFPKPERGQPKFTDNAPPDDGI